MISANNKSMATVGVDHMQDFTVNQYRELLRVAKDNYRFARYHAIPYQTRFILWRHDCDYSLNRARRLALIEQEEGVGSTFFVNPHCEFYNLSERSQSDLVKDIVEAGHDIGLHFEADFYGISTEAQLDAVIENEALLLERMFGVRPIAFSFHNPTPFLLTCEEETYSGLLNCYSRRFKAEIPYCSDSNGYWRFRRLREVLEQGADTCLQVLTHPGWWQEEPLHPRQRIFRSVYGRAESVLAYYDSAVEQVGRINVAGPAAALRFLKELNPSEYELCDYLWNKGRFQTLFMELWRLHERQFNRLCKAVFRKGWQVPTKEINTLFEHLKLGLGGWKLFTAVFESSWREGMGTDEQTHEAWANLGNQVIHGRSSVDPARLEEGCLYLCSVIDALARWGKAQENVRYDGITHLGSIGIPTCKTSSGDCSEELEEVADAINSFPDKRWQDFKTG